MHPCMYNGVCIEIIRKIRFRVFRKYTFKICFKCLHSVMAPAREDAHAHAHKVGGGRFDGSGLRPRISMISAGIYTGP